MGKLVKITSFTHHLGLEGTKLNFAVGIIGS